MKHLFFFFFPLCPSGFSASLAPVSVPSELEAVAEASNGSNSDSFLFSVWSVEDEEGSITVGEAVSTEIGPDLLIFVVGLEDVSDDAIAFAMDDSPIDRDAICEGLADVTWPDWVMEDGANDAGILVGACCFFFIHSLKQTEQSPSVPEFE